MRRQQWRWGRRVVAGTSAGGPTANWRSSWGAGWTGGSVWSWRKSAGSYCCYRCRRRNNRRRPETKIFLDQPHFPVYMKSQKKNSVVFLLPELNQLIKPWSINRIFIAFAVVAVSLKLYKLYGCKTLTQKLICYRILFHFVFRFRRRLRANLLYYIYW